MKYFKSKNIRGNVVFNFNFNPLGDIFYFARGYQCAAKKLKDNFAKRTGYHDYEGYPIFYLYRHALELYLKAITYKSALLINHNLKPAIINSLFLSNHRLDKYIDVMIIIFKSLKWDTEWKNNSFPFDSLEELSEIISEVNTIDPNSDSFRYPTDKKKNLLLKHQAVLNPVQFGNILDGVFIVLEACYITLDNEIEEKAELSIILKEILVMILK